MYPTDIMLINLTTSAKLKSVMDRHKYFRHDCPNCNRKHGDINGNNVRISMDFKRMVEDLWSNNRCFIKS